MSESLDLRNDLLADFVASQPEGKVVNVEAASNMIADVLRGMDRKESEAQTAYTVDPKRDKMDTIAEEFERRTGRKLEGEWETCHNDGAPIINRRQVVDSRTVRQEGIERLTERLRWLRSKPELFEQVKGISVALQVGDKDIKERAAAKLREILERSNKLAGFDWRKGKPSKLIFS